MTQWAALDRDVVIHTVPLDFPVEPSGDPPRWVRAPDNVTVGWIYDRKGERFVEPKTLQNLAEMNTFLDNAIASNTEFVNVQSPNAQQQLQQLRRLTFQVQYLIRIERDHLESMT